VAPQHFAHEVQVDLLEHPHAFFAAQGLAAAQGFFWPGAQGLRVLAEHGRQFAA